MTPFRLAALDGKVWNAQKLSGKTLLIYVWATWSGPCLLQMPDVQKLYEAVQERKDVQLLTFNVDEDPLAAKPYITQHGYAFPVLNAHVYVQQLTGYTSVPRLWIVDANGTWIWEQTGFDARNEEWTEEVLKKIGVVA